MPEGRRRDGEGAGHARSNQRVDSGRDEGSPADRRGARERLKEALDEIFKEKISPKFNLDSVEGKLFGIGTESYTVGSHEFYLAYAREITCSSHWMSGITPHRKRGRQDFLRSYLPRRDPPPCKPGVRWDSDHVIILNDDLLGIAQELVRGNYLARTHIGLDYFDASINRVPPGSSACATCYARCVWQCWSPSGR